jgi:hypothetical protein
MVALLPPAELQFCDANGAPYAGGQINTYVPGTTTPVTTWSEPTGTVANTNPIILDSAGRCIIYASGIVRTILSDALGNLVWDQLSNTLVSAAMAPVCIAPDLPAAKGLLGIVDNAPALAVLTAGAAAEVAARAAADTAEATARAAADTVLTTAISTETTRALAAEAAIGATGIKSGTATTDATGHVRVTYATPFPAATDAAVVTRQATGFTIQNFVLTADRFGFDLWCCTVIPVAPYSAGVYWLATGH